MKTRHFDRLPKPYLAYPKVIQGLILQKIKSDHHKEVNELSQVEYVVDKLHVDPKHLAHYKRICGFKPDQFIPAIYLAVLSQSLQMLMMTQEAFPFQILGLVHIRNTIKQFRPITELEILSLSCQFGAVTVQEKGMQFDFITTAKVGNEIVMQGTTTYLSRQKTNITSNKAQEKTAPDYQLQQVWDVPENTGRQYARVSGDFNLIHIHQFTAKVFGFKQAIAHGMWSKAKALANLPLPDRYEADVWFKLPLYLPSSVEFLTAKQTQEIDFLIRNVKTKKPHVVGVVTPF